MNETDDNDQSLAPLRDLPEEVCLEQVAQLVAGFPLATARRVGLQRSEQTSTPCS